MLNNSFAPIKRAGLFFGFMGAAVLALTLGSGFQETNANSSAAIAQARLDRPMPYNVRLAAADPAQRTVGVTKRAIGGAQQALAASADRTVMR